MLTAACAHGLHDACRLGARLVDPCRCRCHGISHATMLVLSNSNGSNPRRAELGVRDDGSAAMLRAMPIAPDDLGALYDVSDCIPAGPVAEPRDDEFPRIAITFGAGSGGGRADTPHSAEEACTSTPAWARRAAFFVGWGLTTATLLLVLAGLLAAISVLIRLVRDTWWPQ